MASTEDDVALQRQANKSTIAQHRLAIMMLWLAIIGILLDHTPSFPKIYWRPDPKAQAGLETERRVPLDQEQHRDEPNLDRDIEEKPHQENPQRGPGRPPDELVAEKSKKPIQHFAQRPIVEKKTPSLAEQYLGWGQKDALRSFGKRMMPVTCERCNSTRPYSVDWIDEHGKGLKCESCKHRIDTDQLRRSIDGWQKEIKRATRK